MADLAVKREDNRKRAGYFGTLEALARSPCFVCSCAQHHTASLLKPRSSPAQRLDDFDVLEVELDDWLLATTRYGTAQESEYSGSSSRPRARATGAVTHRALTGESSTRGRHHGGRRTLIFLAGSEQHTSSSLLCLIPLNFPTVSSFDNLEQT
eukprot:5313835-Pleurochrysis_carterae.AAC.4